MPQKDVLRFQVTVYYVHILARQESQGFEHLLGKLSNQIQRDATELGILQQLIQIQREHFKDETLMISVHEMR